eukprot:m.78257 g.78257  ORF g.78257 m.78257 type:complete len:297 (-) comp17345_c0_seq1:54-944(-)
MSATAALFAGKKIGFLGLGQMSRFMLQPLLRNGLLQPEQVVATRSSTKGVESVKQEFPGITVTKDNDATLDADLVFWGTKPQDFSDVAEPLRGRFSAKTCVISLMGGVPMRRISDELEHGPVLRVMPNTPVKICKGVLPWVPNAHCTESMEKLSEVSFREMGTPVRLKKEMHIDMATAISGSSPAFFLLYLEGLVEAGVHLGLSRDVCFELARHSMLGTAEMVMQGDELASAKYAVTSPGGATASGLYQAEASALRHTVAAMAWATYRRCLEIAEGGNKKTVYGPGIFTPKVISTD